MRFVSHSPGFQVPVVGQRSHFSNFGDEIIDREGYTVKFSHDLITDDDVHFVERVFADEFGRIHGQTVLADEVTPTPIRERVSVFDTDEAALIEDWDLKTFTTPRGEEIPFKQYVEQTLSRLGVNHPDFRQVETLPANPPWPNYLDFKGSLDQLVARLVEDGYDLREVVRFEEQTGHRQAVIDSLTAVLAEQAREIEEAVQVPA